MKCWANCSVNAQSQIEHAIPMEDPTDEVKEEYLFKVIKQNNKVVKLKQKKAKTFRERVKKDNIRISTAQVTKKNLYNSKHSQLVHTWYEKNKKFTDKSFIPAHIIRQRQDNWIIEWVKFMSV